MFLERTRESHRHSDEHWNRFKGNIGETVLRDRIPHVDFPERVDTVIN